MKILWMDAETTGKDPKRHGIIQIAFLIDIGGKVVEKKVFHMNPEKEISEEAIKIHGITPLAIAQYPQAKEVKAAIERFFSMYINKFDKTDKFIPAGYNVRFDLDFLNQLWLDQGDQYLFSWIRGGAEIDVYRALFFAKWCGYKLILSDYKLSTVAKAMNVSLSQEHDALADIEATRAVAYSLKNFFVLSRKEAEENGKDFVDKGCA